MTWNRLQITHQAAKLSLTTTALLRKQQWEAKVSSLSNLAWESNLAQEGLNFIAVF